MTVMNHRIRAAGLICVLLLLATLLFAACDKSPATNPEVTPEVTPEATPEENGDGEKL